MARCGLHFSLTLEFQFFIVVLLIHCFSPFERAGTQHMPLLTVCAGMCFALHCGCLPFPCLCPCKLTTHPRTAAGQPGSAAALLFSWRLAGSGANTMPGTAAAQQW